MNWLASYLKEAGATVTGSDLRTGGHKASNLPENCDLLVINAAIDEKNPEMLAAKRRGIHVTTREELLAHIMSTFPHRIAVAGSHGKSTTTAMISHIFASAGIAATTHNGAHVVRNVGTYPYSAKQQGSVFITEACEFQRGFLKLDPTVAVITNIDADHLDCFKDLDEVKQAFAEFAAKAQTVITHPVSQEVEKLVSKITLLVPGEHNRQNAKLAAAVAMHFGLTKREIAIGLSTFPGIKGRFQEIGKVWDCTIISDYAHHPAELAAMIQAAKGIYKKPLVVFQPHTYTRTLALFDDFVRSLSNVDCALYKTYTARGKPIPGGGANDLAKALGQKYIATIPTLRKFIDAKSTEHDVIILTGAGDIVEKLGNSFD